jgi:acyl-CoA thioesterase I
MNEPVLPSLYHGPYGAFRCGRNLVAALVIAVLPVAAAADPVTIAALGDSLTAGYGLSGDEGFVPQMQAWLAAQGAEVTLINAGVSGDTTAGGLSRVDWTLTPDVDGMIVALGGNDLLRGIDPAVSRANLEGILQAAQAAEVPVLLVGLSAPGNYGPDFKQAFESMYPDLAAEYGALHFADFLGPMAERATRGESIRDLMQADGIHPNALGVQRVVEAIGPAVLELVEKVGE